MMFDKLIRFFEQDMKTSRLILAALAICAFQGLILAQSTRSQTAAIDSYCATIDKLTKQSKKPDLIFADTADYEDQNTKPKWQKFASEKALEKFRAKSETYSIAYNWLKENRIVASNFTNFSSSGDWTIYIYHTYRPDGTLARVRSELRTFYGDYIITRTRYFNVHGKQIEKTVKFQDLKTHKPKKPTSENEQYFSDDDIYKTTAKLPFAKQITKK
jgi:hypothetical protein